MFRTTLRSLWSHKRRLISTCIAVLLGVAFMAGTLVLTGTINRVFDALFNDAFAGTDALVRGDVLFESEFGPSERRPLPEETVEAVRDIDQVAAAEPYAATQAVTLLDAEGDPMTTGGAPSFVSSWLSDDQLNPYLLAEGRAPEADGEAVVDQNTANNGPFELGDTLKLVTPGGTEELTLVGIARFGEADSAAGAIDVFTTMSQVQEFTGEAGAVDEINARAVDGLDQEDLVAAIEAAGIDDVEVLTGEAAGEELASDIGEAFSFFTIILLVFSLIALFVGWFIISNTFSILVAQRTRELALLRAIGAARRQVLTSVLLEAVIIGLFSGLLGLLAGIGLAAGALAALGAIGVDLPSAGLVIGLDTVGYSLLVGLGVTAIAALMPAVRATRVPPLAALRDVALDRSGTSRIRIGAGIVALLAGLVIILPAFGDDPTTDQLPIVGAGMALIVLAVLVLGPVMARPLSRLLGSPLPAIRGVTGRLSRENAMRNPRRTASTAAAIIIGVTLVGFITVFASSAQSSIRSSIDQGFTGDYIVQPTNQFADLSGAPPALAEELRSADGVDTVTAAGAAPMRIDLPDGEAPSPFVGAIDPESFTRVFDVEMTEGTIEDTPDDGLLLNRQVAASEDLAIGDEVTLTSASGEEATVRVHAITDDAAILQQWTITRVRLDELQPRPTDFTLGILLDDGASPNDARPVLDEVMEPYPTMNLQDRDEFTDSVVGVISTLLNVIYGLLAISIIIALIGIANTLSLSIHERTRELGLLRAMGMTRTQVRTLVRWEAVIVALIGTSVGLLLGLGLSWTLINGLSSQGFDSFSVPVAPLAFIVVGAAILAVVASLWPAYKASKLDVLDAIATE
jgi:putative ABC transport system permease protein